MNATLGKLLDVPQPMCSLPSNMASLVSFTHGLSQPSPRLNKTGHLQYVF